MILQLAPYTVDLETRRVLRSGHAVKWGDKACHLFMLLLQNTPNVTSKEAIFSQVWQGRVVTENSLYKTIGMLRKALNKDGIEIESVFGEGYRLITESDIHTANSSNVESSHGRNFYLVLLSSISLLTLVWFSYEYHKEHSLFGKMKRLEQALAVTKQAFISQINIRNELGEMLSQRFELHQDDSWEKRFYQLYDQMNEQERFLCQQTRAYTEGPLFENNQVALALLTDHPEVITALPLAQELATHLTLWLNKYNRVFKDAEKMCLLYVGVEDGAKYPSEFDHQLSSWIEQNK